MKFQLNANAATDFGMVNSTSYGFVLELHSVKGSGGKPWILNRDLKRIAGTNTWSTDGTEPIILPHGRTFQYRYGERGKAGDNTLAAAAFEWFFGGRPCLAISRQCRQQRCSVPSNDGVEPIINRRYVISFFFLLTLIIILTYLLYDCNNNIRAPIYMFTWYRSRRDYYAIKEGRGKKCLFQL